jgi:hypothetical protein
MQSCFFSEMRSASLSLVISAFACAPPAAPNGANSAPQAEVSVPPASSVPATRPVPAPSRPATCDGSFDEAWPRLAQQLEVGELQALLSPQHGLFVVDNPGAFVVPMHFSDFAAAREQVIGLRPEHLHFACRSLREAHEPRFSCEEERWSVEGCIHSVDPPFSMERWYRIAIEYGVVPARDGSDMLQRAAQADDLIEHGVYSTDDTLGLYFGLVDCTWRLLAVDIVTPCSA